MTNPGKITLTLASILFLTACGGSSSSSSDNSNNNTDTSQVSGTETETETLQIPSINIDALNGLSLPSTHFGHRKIQFSGELDSTFNAEQLTLSLTHNGNTVDVVITENTISSELELSNNQNVFVVTISNGLETQSREFSVEYPFVSLETFQPAAVVVGQQDFTGTDSDTTASTFEGPYGNAFVHANYLYLPDYENDRILGFNGIPSVNGAAADFVIGQEDFTNVINGGDGLTSLGGPQNMQVVDGKFYILSYNSNRIIVSDTIPTTTGQLVPSVVIGQIDSASTDDACTANSLDSPESFIIADNKLIVTDNGNDRVLIWNSLPTISGVEADVVLGYDNFTCERAEEETVVILQPEPLQPEPLQPPANFQPPALFEPETPLIETPVVEIPTEDEFSLDSPSGVWSDGKTLLIADSGNNRVVIWNTFPSTNNVKPDVILGEDFLTENTPVENTPVAENIEAPELAQLDSPYHLHSNGNQLFLTDNNNNRLLIWNSLPTSNDQQPDVIIGQSNLINTNDNDDDQDGDSDRALVITADGGERERVVASNRTLSSPTGAYTVGNQLIITDGGNSRFLIFNDVTK